MLLLEVGDEFAIADAAALGLVDAADSTGLTEAGRDVLGDGDAPEQAATMTTSAALPSVTPSRWIVPSLPPTRAAYLARGGCE